MPAFLPWNGTTPKRASPWPRCMAREAVIEQAFSVSMLPSKPGGPPVDPGQRIAAALAARGIGRLETLVATGAPISNCGN